MGEKELGEDPLKRKHPYPVDQRSRWLPSGAWDFACSVLRTKIGKELQFDMVLPPEAPFCWTGMDFQIYFHSGGCVKPKLKPHYYLSPECPTAIVDLVVPILNGQNWLGTSDCKVTEDTSPPIFIWEGSRRTIDPLPTLSMHGLVNRVLVSSRLISKHSMD